ncbi:MAG: hypothetical protein IK099_03255 [Clostridia bacterium]|nr:hypothetical protein [Clostridia bacterium]
MSGNKRVFALLLCIGMALMLLVSSAYLVSVSGHHCDGDGHCEICEVVIRTEALLSGFVFCRAALAFFAYMTMRREEKLERRPTFALPLTLVGRKVQLNN